MEMKIYFKTGEVFVRRQNCIRLGDCLDLIFFMIQTSDCKRKLKES